MRMIASSFDAHTSGFDAPDARPLLNYAMALLDGVGRLSPEAGVLARWLGNYHERLGLPANLLPRTGDDGNLSERTIDAVQWREAGARLRERLAMLPAGSALDAALAGIGTALALDALERDILALVVRYRLDLAVERLADQLNAARGRPTRLRPDPDLFALLLRAPPAEVARRLRIEERLRASGIIGVDQWGDVEPLQRLLSLLLCSADLCGDLRAAVLKSASTTALPWSAFVHLGAETELAAAVLRGAIAGREPGIHILLYGPPGTGKTALAASLAARLGVPLYAVAEADDQGKEPTRSDRLHDLLLAQRLMGEAPGLLLFDEAEDLFRNHGDTERAASSKVYVNRLLETARAPIIWTANDIGAFGPAALRRMTLCIEVRTPDIETRAALWMRLGAEAGIRLEDDAAHALARAVPAAPGVVRTALLAAHLAGGETKAVEIAARGIVRAMNGGAPPAPEPRPEADYDPTLSRADCDLAALADRLARPNAPRAVSLLLSGPSGTGKSAFARHLAQRMRLPILQKRASDLLGPYVGETEQRIAAAFAEARDRGAFLILDEADSLLMDRAGAVRAFEVSQVNEMLTWMEDHPMPFACTTNLDERLDRASLRRFLLKVRFDWLTPAQAAAAFRIFFGTEPPADLATLYCLTPADFAMVSRRCKAMGSGLDKAVLMSMLHGELAGRAAKRTIGYQLSV